MFTRVTGEYVPQYSKWLRTHPFFLQRNRYFKFKFNSWDGNPYHLDLVHSRYRNFLLKLARSEHAVMVANKRLKQSVLSEISLNTYRATIMRANLEADLLTKPIFELDAEIEILGFLLHTLPDCLFSRFTKLRQLSGNIAIELTDYSSVLRKLHVLKGQLAVAPAGALPSAVAYRHRRALHVEKLAMRKEGKSIRMREKRFFQYGRYGDTLEGFYRTSAGPGPFLGKDDHIPKGDISWAK